MAVAAVPLALVAVGSAIGAAGALSQGSATKAADDYNAKVANINAGVVTDQASWEAQQTLIRGQRLAGSQRATLGKLGLVGGSGADVMRDSAINNELDAMSTIYKGNVSANNYRNTANLDTFAGRTAVTNSQFSALSTLVGGAAKGFALDSQNTGSNAPVPRYDASGSNADVFADEDPLTNADFPGF